LQTYLNNIIKVRVLIAISYIVILLFFWWLSQMTK